MNRLSLNSGTAIDRLALPRDDWRPLSQCELNKLVTCDADPANAIQLFQLPERLKAEWWQLAGMGEEGLAGEGFKKFASEILEYLLFKKLSLPAECALELILTSPGEPSARASAGGLLCESNLLGGINFSDEDSALVFLNLPATASSAGQENAWLLEYRDYPLTRVNLHPGEGFWLPRLPIIMDRNTLGREEIDVHLAIKQDP